MHNLCTTDKILVSFHKPIRGNKSALHVICFICYLLYMLSALHVMCFTCHVLCISINNLQKQCHRRYFVFNFVTFSLLATYIAVEQM